MKNINNYDLQKTLAKTVKNNSELIQIDTKTAVDISHLQDYELNDFILDDIKNQLKHLSVANRIMFCGRCETFQGYDGILKFQACKVYKDNGTKHCYTIFILQSIDRLNYGERTTVYNQYFNENMINITENNIFEGIKDIELD